MENIDTVQQEPVEIPLVNYYVTNSTGDVIRCGTCPQEGLNNQAIFEGESVFTGEPPARTEEVCTATYQYMRKSQYPTIEEQLDIIYHSGIDVWKSMITEIKTQYPKDDTQYTIDTPTV